MAEPEEVRANQGTAEQLPQGAAQTLNEAMPDQLMPPELLDEAMVADEEEAGMAEVPDLEAASSSDYEPSYIAENEDEDFITGPTTLPDQDVTHGVTAMPSQQRVPPRLVRGLPAFVRAASMPGASEQMRFLAAFLAREANK